MMAKSHTNRQNKKKHTQMWFRGLDGEVGTTREAGRMGKGGSWRAEAGARNLGSW